MTVARFSPDGLQVYVGTSAGDVAIFNLRTKNVGSVGGACQKQPQTDHPASLFIARNSQVPPQSSTLNSILLDGKCDDYYFSFYEAQSITQGIWR